MEMEPSGSDEDTILHAELIKKNKLMGIWDLDSFFVCFILMEQ